MGARQSLGTGLDFGFDYVDDIIMGILRDHLPNLAIIVVAIWIGILSYFLVSEILKRPEFDSWGDFSTQRIATDGNSELEVPDVDHVFSIASTRQIETMGMKCLDNDQKEVITIGGVVYWYMVIPPGFQSEAVVYEGNSTMNPGCTSYTYMNTIPKEVIEEVNLKLETEPYVIMNIQGYTVPYVNGKEHGARATWSTENFAFVR